MTVLREVPLSYRNSLVLVHLHHGRGGGVVFGIPLDVAGGCGNTAEVERALGIKSGRAWHIKKQIGPVRANLLKELYLACVDTEYAIKSGRVQERAALNALLLKIYQAKNATK